jgi:AcrR family transcriptional regulator
MVIGKRSQKREETRQEILAAAAKLFSEKGYGQSSVEDIAAVADVVKGTFYYNFGSKEDVVIALRHQSVQKAISEAETMAAEGVSPVQCIEHYLVTTSRWSEENPELASVLFNNGPLFLASRQKKNEIPGSDASDGDASAPAPARGETGKSTQAPPLALALKNLVLLAQSAGELHAALEPSYVAALITFIGMHTHLTWAAEGMQGSPCQQVVTNFRAVLTGLAGR